jgi:hypothetical protein
MTRTQALLADPNHFDLNGLGICTRSVNREADFIVMYVCVRKGLVDLVS